MLRVLLPSDWQRLSSMIIAEESCVNVNCESDWGHCTLHPRWMQEIHYNKYSHWTLFNAPNGLPGKYTSGYITEQTNDIADRSLFDIQ